MDIFLLWGEKVGVPELSFEIWSESVVKNQGFIETKKIIFTCIYNTRLSFLTLIFFNRHLLKKNRCLRRELEEYIFNRHLFNKNRCLRREIKPSTKKRLHNYDLRRFVIIVNNNLIESFFAILESNIEIKIKIPPEKNPSFFFQKSFSHPLIPTLTIGGSNIYLRYHNI